MLVEVADLRNYMDISFTNRQEEAAKLILEGLQSELESFLKRPVEITEFTESYRLGLEHEPLPQGPITLYDTGSYGVYGGGQPPAVGAPAQLLTPPITVYFRNTPILSVTEVTLTSGSASATATTLVEGRDFNPQRYGIDIYTAWANDRLDVTYTAGLDGANIRVFKLLILRAASREAQNLHDDVVGLKELNTRDVAPLTTGFTAEELKSVDRFRRKQV